MQSFNDAHFARLAKRANGNTLFRFETLGRLSSTAMILLAVACLAAALPVALLTQKEEVVEIEPYLELRVKPVTSKVLLNSREDSLHHEQ